MTLAAAGGQAAGAYIELGAALVLLAFAARLAMRLELSPIAFYLLGGLALGAIKPPDLTAEFVELMGNLGVVLLLFLLGLEYTPSELHANLRAQAPAGVVDAVLNFVPGCLVGLLLGWGPLAAVVLGGATWVSSSGVIAKALADLGRLGNRETPAVLSVLVTEDLAMVAYLPLVGALLVGGGALAAVGSLAVAGVAAAATLVAALRYGDRLARLVEHSSQEVLLLSALGLVLLVAGAAERLQVSAAVGAFLVGIALSGEVAQRTRELLTPLRDFAAALFFLFFGLSIDTGALGRVLVPILVLALLTALTKVVTGWWAARRAGIGRAGRGRAGAALIARGEFSIVIAGLGVGAGLEPQLGALAAGYVLLLALAGPIVMRFDARLLPVVELLDRMLAAARGGRVARRLLPYRQEGER
ncbi:MAG: cation:proton antiporter [Actinomycetota bacterium]|nr:cation:proton antiporter [Actinomycetota bacterium]